MSNVKGIAVKVIVIGVLAAIIYGQQKAIQKLTRERDTYQANTESLMTGIETIRKDSAQQAYKIQALTLKKKEYEAYREEDAKTIKDLNVKLKNVTSASKQVLEIKVPVYVPVEKTSNGTKSVKLENQHISFVGIIRNDSLDADISIPVEIKQWAFKIPKHKFLWWSWGCKGFSQIIHTNNPYVNLKYSEIIYID